MGIADSKVYEEYEQDEVKSNVVSAVSAGGTVRAIRAIRVVRASRVMRAIGGYLVLTKPRIVTLLAFTAYCAMILAGHRLPGVRETAAGILGLAMCAGGSAAINMWYDQDIDAVMKRTRKRPIPTGQVNSFHAFWFGASLTLLGTVTLLVFATPLSALLGFLGAVYYGVVYTMLLKRRTPQNIVIGGGAGAFPPLVGYATVTGHLSPAAWWLFLIIFLWTPGHFWALALYKTDDYQKAGVPMMPVVRGARMTKWNMLFYSLLLMLCVGLGPFIGIRPLLVTVTGLTLTGWFVINHLYMLRERTSNKFWAKRTFFTSLLVLPALFTVIAISGLL